MFVSARKRARPCVGPALVLFVVVLALGGYAQLLPKDRSEVDSAWGSFEEAKAAIGKVEPYQTRADDLTAIGFAPYANANVSLLTYSDIVLRFPLGAALYAERLDKGVRECLMSGNACSGYSIDVKHVHRDRIGNFWLDSLAFRRETEITG